MNIMFYLQPGRAGRKSTAQLCEETGCTPRQICAAVERERKKGVVILTTPRGGGYWLPDPNDPDLLYQVEAFIRFMTGKKTLETLTGAFRLFTELERQEGVNRGG